MALGDSLRGLFTNNPVNRVGPTGEPNIGGSNVTDLIGRSVGGLLGRDMRTEAAKLTEGIQGIGQDDPDRLRKMVELQLQSAVRAGDRPAAAQLANTLERIRDQETTAAKLATPKVASGQTQFFVDDENNRYARVMSVDSLGQASFKLEALEGAPDSPVGKLLPVGPRGLTIEGRIQEAGDLKAEETIAENWADQVNNIYAAGFNSIDEIPKLERVLNIIEKPDFDTGGLANVIEEAKDFFGLSSGDVGEFKAYTAEILTAKLDDFTGAISNAEREYLEANLAGFKRSKGVNTRLLRNVLNGFKKAQSRAIEYSNREASGNPFSRGEWFNYINKTNTFAEPLDFTGNKKETVKLRDL